MTNHVVLHDAITGKWLHFHSLKHVVAVNNIDMVVPELKRIENIVSEQELYAAGFISYEASPGFDPALKAHTTTFPLLWFGLYTTPDIISLPAVPSLSDNGIPDSRNESWPPGKSFPHKP